MEQVIDFLKVLADPTRMKIFKFLQHGEVYVCELSQALGISQPTVSQHMRRFKHLSLVCEQRQGKKVCYTIDQTSYDQLRRQLDQLLDTDISGLAELAAEWKDWQLSQSQPHVLQCKQNSFHGGK